MNKADLIAKMADVVGTQKLAKEAVDCMLDTISQALTQKDSVQIAGFGTFKVGQRQARTGRNPQTGETIKIAARNTPKFVPGKALKDAVN